MVTIPMRHNEKLPSVMLSGASRLTEKTVITADRALIPTAEQLRGYFSPATGCSLPINPKTIRANVIQLQQSNSSASLGEEGYELYIAQQRVLNTGKAASGIFWRRPTLRQLFPEDRLRGAKVDGVDWIIPRVRIADPPRFRWRWLMIDFSRTFWSKRPGVETGDSEISEADGDREMNW